MIQPCCRSRSAAGSIVRWTGQLKKSYPGIIQTTLHNDLIRRRWNGTDARDASNQQLAHSTSVADLVNPPTSTLPPQLNLPEREGSNGLVHLFRIGRAYGKFYWSGLKLTWSNHKEAKELRLSLTAMRRELRKRDVDTWKAGTSTLDLCALAAVMDRLKRDPKVPRDNKDRLNRIAVPMSRSTFQRLARDEYDWGKVPKFAVLVAICGEYLPLLVPFMPGVVPKTCRIPQQVDGMRKKMEQRKKASLERIRTQHDGTDQKAQGEMHLTRLEAALQLAKKENRSFPNEVTAKAVGISSTWIEIHVRAMDNTTLKHASICLGTHSSVWDKLGISLPRSMLESRVKKQLRYLALDDGLLMRYQGGVEALTEVEVRNACEERSIPVTERETSDLRQDLKAWLETVKGPNYSYDFHGPLMSGEFVSAN